MAQISKIKDIVTSSKLKTTISHKFLQSFKTKPQYNIIISLAQISKIKDFVKFVL